MNKIILSTVVMLASSLAFAGNKTAEYEISVQNITKGQPLTPMVVAAHGAGFQLFKLGEEASEGLKAQAKDGATSVLIADIKANQAVTAVEKGSAPILPGEKATLTIQVSPAGYLSMSGMLGRTNDAFVAGRYMRLPLRKGSSVAYLLPVYDAGAEINTESCSDIPAPPCGNPNKGPDSGEGFVTTHPGVFGIADLDVLRDTFGKAAAKVVITRK